MKGINKKMYSGIAAHFPSREKKTIATGGQKKINVHRSIFHNGHNL